MILISGVSVECFWIRLAFESVTSVKYMDPPVWTDIAESFEQIEEERLSASD